MSRVPGEDDNGQARGCSQPRLQEGSADDPRGRARTAGTRGTLAGKRPRSHGSPDDPRGRARTAGTAASVSAPIDRRQFIHLAGFGTAALGAFAGCSRPPEQELIPYLEQPPEMKPGRPVWYASACPGCAAGCGVLVKVRDGRPIKLEGNPDHPLSRGGLCAAGQASLLGLYDHLRLMRPRIGGTETTWAAADAKVAAKLDEIARDGGRVRVLSGTIASGSERLLVERFLARFHDGRLVEYDPVSVSAIPAAHEATHGRRVLPHYRFDRARVIAAFDADFLGTWISPVEFAAQYGRRRDPDKPGDYSRHEQYESRLSTTGARADRRVAATPSAIRAALIYLAALVGEPSADGDAARSALPPKLRRDIERLAGRLDRARGEGLVVCGLQDRRSQRAVNAINHRLGNYGATIDLGSPSRQLLGDDDALRELLHELEAGRVDALIIHDANPVYDLPDGDRIGGWIERVPLAVACALRADETSARADVIAALSHPLECWSDRTPLPGLATVVQPAIRPLGNTRSFAEMIAAWSGEPAGGRELIRREWRERIQPELAPGTDFQSFWRKALKHGYAGDGTTPLPLTLVKDNQTVTRAGSWRGAGLAGPVERAGDGWELALYAKPSLPDGRHAYNPILQELPDPISKICWDNYACLSPADARRLGVADGDRVQIAAGGRTLTLPAHVQPGQPDGVVAVALAYGRDISRRFEHAGPQWLEGDTSTGENGLVGVAASPLLLLGEDGLARHRSDVTVQPAGGRVEFAFAQEYDRLDVPARLAPPDGGRRELIAAGTLAEYTERPDRFVPHPHMEGDDLWPEDHTYDGHHWGLAIDLNKCTGCNGCVAGCQIENNVPVVGRDEVRRNREMHWLRIDRYYVEDGEETSAAFQPIMCQQCDHAPCETVCPVLATVHSAEGLNQQIYNRCVGTRYCANNCPYKMRRFNWFNYPRGTEREKLVLNPDVTVRSRGIMEKCTFCVQRIQEAKLEARRLGRPLRDGEITPACQQSCPTGAIVFGDMNDPDSELSMLMNSKRSYKLLEELNVRPSVNYLAIVHNRPRGGEVADHG